VTTQSKFVPPPGTLTILAMVRVGPWTIRNVYLGDWTNCERCDARHKEVWECEVDSDSPRLATDLGGKVVWCIGSTCGPTLMLVSDEEWKERERPIKSVLRLAIRTRRVIDVARVQNNGNLPAFVEERLQLLLEGALPEREKRHLGMVVTTHGRWLKLWK
jgi:hypothetical protein